MALRKFEGKTLRPHTFGFREEEDDDNDEDNDTIDYSETTIAELPHSARLIIETITKCKSLVRYVKKVNN
jgi:hypothetical protein